MATNTQNTVAGTPNGSSVLSGVNGNWFLEQLDALTNVAMGVTSTVGNIGGSALDTYSSFKDRLKTLGIIRDQSSTPAMQSLPNNMIENPAQWLSDPANVQKALLYGAVAATVLGGAFYLLKKK